MSVGMNGSDPTYHYIVSRTSAETLQGKGRGLTTGPGIAVEVVIAAPVTFVWDDVQDISSHVEWMQDAEEIRFLTKRHRGVGTRFECKTVVGPFKLTDVMEITNWKHAQAMGVHHQVEHRLFLGRETFLPVVLRRAIRCHGCSPDLEIDLEGQPTPIEGSYRIQPCQAAVRELGHAVMLATLLCRVAA